LANFYSPTSGGLRTTIKQLAHGYATNDVDFWVVVPGEKFSVRRKSDHTRVELPGISVANTGYRVMPSATKALGLLERIRPDVVEVSDRLTLTKVGRWAKARSTPSIVFSHESVSGLASRYLGAATDAPIFGPALATGIKAANQRLGNAFDCVVCTTDYAATDFRKTTANVVKIPLGVDLETFNPRRFDASTVARLRGGHPLSMVVCTRLHPEKRPERAIAILQELFTKGVDVRLTFVGEGPLRMTLQRRSRGLPVAFEGFVHSRERVAELLASADVVVAPGPIETFGLAALEALACGTPVVASGEGALAEVIGDAGAVADGSIASFCDGVQRVLAADEAIRRRRARVRAEMFPWSRTVSRMMALHQQLANLRSLSLPRAGAVSVAA
jgi:alpha-1,6-mannosyltransferase